MQQDEMDGGGDNEEAKRSDSIKPAPLNRGVAASLNLGVSQILKQHQECRYIFRLDSDDICMPERIQVQLDYMEINQDLDVCGSSIEIFNDANPEKQYRMQIYANIPNLLEYLGLLSCPLAHPTVVFRVRGLK